MNSNMIWLAVVAALAGSGYYAYHSTDLFDGFKAESADAADAQGKAEKGKHRQAKKNIDVSKLNAVAQASAKLGVQDCLARINQVTNFVTSDSQSGAFLFASPKQPNRSMHSVTLEVQTPKGLSYSSASFAPIGAEGCGALYEAVVYWENTCDDVAKKGFEKLKPTGKVREQITVLGGGPNLRVFLMPAGSGCVSVKKELIY